MSSNAPWSVLLRHATQACGQGRVRHLARLQRHTSSGHHAHAGSPGVLLDLDHQARLAYPELAADKRQRRCACACGFQRRIEHTKL